MSCTMIPQPYACLQTDSIPLTGCMPLAQAKPFETTARFLRDTLPSLTDSLVFKYNESFGAEEYILRVNESTVCVEAKEDAGAFYAVMSLRQLLDAQTDINGTAIHDKPRYAHRGLMLDECRHFFGKDEVLKILDKMAMLKMNRFHWHLSDDQGFRVESERFPLLNEIGSRREHKVLGDFMVRAKGEPYGGYYTKQDIREIQQFARERHIEIIPEIDLPGHARAILASYPHIGCRDYGTTVWSKAGISSEIICCGKEASRAFLFDLLDELCDLFEGRYFHIGGDEASYKNWKRCPDCRSEMDRRNLRNEKELQSWFSATLSAHLKTRGKTAIIWNDCLTRDMDDDIVCQFWTLDHIERTKDLIGNRPRIYSPVTHLYLDNRYSRLPTQKVYAFRHEDFGLAGRDDSVLGVEACVWTEWLEDADMLEYVLFPRLAAVAEIGWAHADKDERDFMERLRIRHDYLFGDTGYCALDYHDKPPGFEKKRNRRHLFGARGFEYKENLEYKQNAAQNGKGTRE